MIQYFGTTEAWGADPHVFWPWAYQNVLTTGQRLPPKGLDDFKPLVRALVRYFQVLLIFKSLRLAFPAKAKAQARASQGQPRPASGHQNSHRWW